MFSRYKDTVWRSPSKPFALQQIHLQRTVSVPLALLTWFFLSLSLFLTLIPLFILHEKTLWEQQGVEVWRALRKPSRPSWREVKWCFILSNNLSISLIVHEGDIISYSAECVYVSGDMFRIRWQLSSLTVVICILMPSGNHLTGMWNRGRNDWSSCAATFSHWLFIWFLWQKDAFLFLSFSFFIISLCSCLSFLRFWPLC